MTYRCGRRRRVGPVLLVWAEQQWVWLEPELAELKLEIKAPESPQSLQSQFEFQTMENAWMPLARAETSSFPNS